MAADAVDDGSPLARLLDHIRSAVVTTLPPERPGPNAEPPPEDVAVLEKLAAALQTVDYVGPLVPETHQALDRWLVQAVAGTRPEHRNFADAVARSVPHLQWHTPYPDLAPTPELQRFWANYCFAVLCAPGDGARGSGPFRSEELSLFLTVQGADVVYGRHFHPAIEVYGTVSGSAQWLRGDEGFRLRSPGEVFVHQSTMVHATTTNSEPIISWVAWLGDLQTPPTMETL